MSQTRIGISGWRYEPWRGTFYPKDLPQKRELEFASRELNSIEINGSFYSLQSVASWKRWYDETPDDFVFAVKGGQFITHIRRLKEVKIPLANFFAQGLFALKEKLGPILWQFPPNFVYDPDRFSGFFELLPRDMSDAAKLARHHDARMRKGSYVDVEKNRKLRYALEIRHESFRTAEFVKLLRRHDVALVVADTAGKWPFMEDLTSDFVYVRLHGDKQIYVSGYTPEALDRWAQRVKAWRKGGEIREAVHVSDQKPRKRSARDVFAYFDNDVKVRSPFDAIGLAQRVGGFIPEHSFGKSTKKVSEKARQHWPLTRRKRK